MLNYNYTLMHIPLVGCETLSNFRISPQERQNFGEEVEEILALQAGLGSMDLVSMLSASV
jgi:hypothetical protein